uniref:Uncharacterized protein n=1 Tax=Eiseniibacteriota bacterium TaxID=2212470 RepID=A0A832MLA1_UNCEI
MRRLALIPAVFAACAALAVPARAGLPAPAPASGVSHGLVALEAVLAAPRPAAVRAFVPDRGAVRDLDLHARAASARRDAARLREGLAPRRAGAAAEARPAAR